MIPTPHAVSAASRPDDPPVPAGTRRRRLEAIALERLTPRPAPGRFTAAECAGLPEPVRRYLTAAIGDAAPLAQSTRLRMRGRIRLGRWVPFTARQVLAPHHGFLWRARAMGAVSGHDRYIDGVGEMHFAVLGLATVLRAVGPDTDRSAAGRCAAEAIWVPTALLPRFGVEWSADDDTHIRARYALDDTPVDLRCTVDARGHLRDMVFDRWGDPDGTGRHGWHRFGGTVARSATSGAVTIPVAGHLGWHYGTSRWADGEFFRYEITAADVVTAAG